MEPKILQQVVTQIHKRYPEFAGCKPRVRRQAPPTNATALGEPTYLLTFSTAATAQSAGGSRTMPRYLRVVVNERGKLIKITTSR